MFAWRLLLPLAFTIPYTCAKANIPMLLHKGAQSSKGEILDLWKVPLPDNHITGADFVEVCHTWLMTPVCTGDPGTCMFADSNCVGLAAETQEGCGVPLQGTVKLLGYATNQDAHLKNVCVYIAPGNGYDDGFLCGPAASQFGAYGLSCNSVLTDRYVLCAGSNQMDRDLDKTQDARQEVQHLRHTNAVLHQIEARERSDIHEIQHKLVNGSAHATQEEHIHSLRQQVKYEEAEIHQVVFVAFVVILGLAHLLRTKANSSDLLLPSEVPLLQESAGWESPHWQPPHEAVGPVQAATGFQPSVHIVEYNDADGQKVRCVRVVAPGRRMIDNGRSVEGSAKVEVAPDGCSTKIHLKLVKEADLPGSAVCVVQHGAPDANGTWEKTLDFPDGTWQRLEPITSLGLDMHGVFQVFLGRRLPPQEEEISNTPHSVPPCQHFSINSETLLSAPGSTDGWAEVKVVSDKGDVVSSVGPSEDVDQALKQGVRSTVATPSVASGKNETGHSSDEQGWAEVEVGSDNGDVVSSCGASEAVDQALKNGIQSSLATESVVSGNNETGHSIDEQYGGVSTLVDKAPAVDVAAAADDRTCNGDVQEAPSANAAASEIADDDDGSECSWTMPPSFGEGP